MKEDSIVRRLVTAHHVEPVGQVLVITVVATATDAAPRRVTTTKVASLFGEPAATTVVGPGVAQRGHPRANRVDGRSHRCCQLYQQIRKDYSSTPMTKRTRTQAKRVREQGTMCGQGVAIAALDLALVDPRGTTGVRTDAVAGCNANNVTSVSVSLR